MAQMEMGAGDPTNYGRRLSGLLVPDAGRSLGELALPGAAIDPMENIAAYASEEEIGLSVSTVDGLRERLAGVDFEPAMHLAGFINAKVHTFRHDSDKQLRLAAKLYSEELQSALGAFVAGHPNALPFAEQNCFILQRLLIEAAIEAPADQDLSAEEFETVVVALLGCSSVARGVAEDTAPKDPKGLVEWLSFFIQNGAYNSSRQPLGEIVRAQELFGRLAALPEHEDPACPLGTWCREDYGFDVGELMTLGFAFWALTNTFDEAEEADYPVRVKPENVDDLLDKLDWLDRREQALAALSASRAELQAEFAEAGSEPANLAWETRPIMRRPFLRCSDEGLILMSPRAMLSWLGEGFHYRLLDSVQKRSIEDKGKTSRAYSAYAGRLLEAYAVELTKSAHPGPRLVASGRVFGEQPYGPGGQKKTSDVAVDLGLDLVLVEVSTSRLRADTLIIGDTERVEGDLERMLIAKLKQLDGCIAALINGEAQLPEVDVDLVQRIWPVVVTAGEIAHTDPLWEYVEERGGEYLNQPKVRPLTLLDTEDYAQLLGLVEQGHALHDLLVAKNTGDFQRFELAIWLDKDPKAPAVERPPAMVDNAYARDTARMEAALDFGRGI
jgi:hypothetical protein